MSLTHKKCILHFLCEGFPAYGDIHYSNYLLLWHRDLVPAPPSIQAEKTNNIKLGGNNQKLILLSLGNHLI